jgi:hypothetical protein
MMENIERHIQEDIINDLDTIPLFAISEYYATGEDRKLYMCAFFNYDTLDNRKILEKYFYEVFPDILYAPIIYTRKEVVERYSDLIPKILLDRRFGRGYHCTWFMHITIGI